MKRFTFSVLILILFLIFAGCSNSNSATNTNSSDNEKKTNYPQKPVTLIVPYAAGGGTDLVARGLVSAAEKHLGESIAVVNKPGGGGGIGMTEGANAKPDGYTATMVTVESTILPNLGLAQFSYDDYTPIAQINFDPSIIVVRSDSSFETIDDLINYAKDNKKKVRIGNGAANGVQHFSALAVEKETGVEFEHVPFEGGNQAVTSLLGNHIEAVSISAPEVLEQVRANTLRPLAVLADNRLESLPDVPTFKELGIDVPELGTWKGVAVPKDTPEEIVQILSDAFIKAADDEEFTSYMNESGLGLVVKDSSEFYQLMEDSNEFFKGLILKLGLKE